MSKPPYRHVAPLPGEVKLAELLGADGLAALNDYLAALEAQALSAAHETTRSDEPATFAARGSL